MDDIKSKEEYDTLSIENFNVGNGDYYDNADSEVDFVHKIRLVTSMSIQWWFYLKRLIWML